LPPHPSHLACWEVEEEKPALGWLWVNISLWNIDSGITELIFSGHTGQVRSVTFDQDGHHILSSSGDGTVRLWNYLTGLELRRYTTHTEWVNQAVYSVDGETVFSASWDETLIQWYIHDTVEELDEWSKHNRYIRDLTCNEERIYLVKATTTCE
jgi:WD40 repeat protein